MYLSVIFKVCLSHMVLWSAALMQFWYFNEKNNAHMHGIREVVLYD